MRDDLKTLEQRWGLAVQSAAFGVWDLDILAQRVHYSPEWKTLLGYDGSQEPDSTATWRERVHPDDLQPVERDEDDRPLRMIGTLTDITDRREAESLRIARDRAEAANRAKTEFLSRMSHELRTPLNAVLGFAQLLAQRIGQGGDVAQQRRHVAQIEQAGWQLLAMIDDVLELAQFEKGQLKLRIGEVALPPLLQAAAERAGAAAQTRGIRVKLGAPPPSACVRADPARLAPVLDNLIGNAVKYNRDGGSLSIEGSASALGWTLSVTDTGSGIPAEQLQHLFEPFNRLGRSQSAIGGVGVGLVLTRWLVEAMGGRVAVESTEGEGSRFAVDLPAA